MDKKKLSLYFHVPFCEKRCSYCDFCSVENKNVSEIRRYFEYMTGEIELFAETFAENKNIISSIYFGGGTPSFAPEECIAGVIEKVNSIFIISEDVEITVEVNPRSALRETFIRYKSAGVNRLSIGMQSFTANELKSLGRSHTVKEATEAYETARSAGFDNIGVDIIFGIPGQSIDSLNTTLETLIKLNPEHVSAYSLTLEPGTKMHTDVTEERISLPVENMMQNFYIEIFNALSDNGYHQYEVSNYCRTGYESKHNSHYWKHLPYQGFGLTAHSFDSNIRFWNTTDFGEYYSKLDGRILPVYGKEDLTTGQLLNETIMLGLRTSGGISLPGITERFGIKAAEKLKHKLLYMFKDPETDKYFECHKTKKNHLADRIILNSSGLFISDSLITPLLFDEEELQKFHL
jgi:oxygen-independent coproporphyrinogen-3 oxidase